MLVASVTVLPKKSPLPRINAPTGQMLSPPKVTRVEWRSLGEVSDSGVRCYTLFQACSVRRRTLVLRELRLEPLREHQRARRLVPGATAGRLRLPRFEESPYLFVDLVRRKVFVLLTQLNGALIIARDYLPPWTLGRGDKGLLQTLKFVDARHNSSLSVVVGSRN